MSVRKANKLQNLVHNQLRALLPRSALLIIGILLVGYGSFGFIKKQLYTGQAQPSLPDSRTVVDSDTDEPSETPVSLDSPYEVPADQPRKLTMPTINSSGFIQPVGITSTNQVAVPTNIYFAGWYVNSVKPGDPGVSLLDGHVRGRYAAGIFENLVSAASGDKFEVEFGDKSVRQFEVVSVTSYSINDIDAHLLVQDPSIENQLNIITCGGAYDWDAQQYPERVLVISKRI